MLSCCLHVITNRMYASSPWYLFELSMLRLSPKRACLCIVRRNVVFMLHMLHLVEVTSQSFTKVDVCVFQSTSALQVCRNSSHIFLNYFEFLSALCLQSSTLAGNYVIES